MGEEDKENHLDKEITDQSNEKSESETEEKLELSDDETRTRSCLLYTSPSPRDGLLSRMPSSA